MRLLVCGGRTFSSSDTFNWLEANAKSEIYHVTGVHSDLTIDVLIHGGARGADEGGAEWGESEGAEVIEFKPNWEAYGKAAGPIRNNEMLFHGKPDVIIAFPGGKGTKYMIETAKKFGAIIIEV